MRVMAVVAHPDDEVIGPGGTLAKHAMAGDTVHVVILAEGTTSRAGDSNHESSLRRSHEATRSAAELLKFSSSTRFDLADNRLDILPLLELAQRVEQEVAAVEPEVVFTHHPGDLNIDHELTARVHNRVPAARQRRQMALVLLNALGHRSGTRFEAALRSRPLLRYLQHARRQARGDAGLRS